MKNKSVKLMLLGLAFLLVPSGVVGNWAVFVLRSSRYLTPFTSNLFTLILVSILPIIGLVFVLLGFFANDERGG